MGHSRVAKRECILYRYRQTPVVPEQIRNAPKVVNLQSTPAAIPSINATGNPSLLELVTIASAPFETLRHA